MQSNILKAKMKLMDVTQGDLSEMMAKRGVVMDKSSLNLKINGRREFKASEISAINQILGLSDTETMEIFFTQNVS